MLVLREVDVPHWPFAKIALFATPEKAISHLCDHVLTRPEAHYWGSLIPQIDTVLDLNDDDSLYRFARSLWSSRPPVNEVQLLYDAYSSVLVQAMSDAIKHGWYWAQDEEDGPSWRGLGVSGAFVIWRQTVLQTGMLLGYTVPPPSPEARTPRKSNPLPRQHSYRYRGAELRKDNTLFPPMTPDNLRTRYHIFKKSAVRVRREFKHAMQENKVTSGGAYLGSLQLGVPDFATWKTISEQRLSCGKILHRSLSSL